MTDSFTTRLTVAVPEKGTALITGTIRDHTGAALPAASITTLTLTLYERISKSIINSRTASNVKNTGGGTVDAAGLFTMVLAPADNALVNQLNQAGERHIAQFDWTYNAGAATGRALVDFPISNFPKVT